MENKSEMWCKDMGWIAVEHATHTAHGRVLWTEYQTSMFIEELLAS